MQTVELVSLDYGLAEVFEYVYKQQNIGQQVVVVILTHVRYVEPRPRLFGPLIVLFL